MSHFYEQWTIDDEVPGADIGYRAILDSDDCIICNPSPMGERNARLIAAAPTMFELLREILAIARKYEYRDCMIDADSLIEYVNQ